jgi:hypothetical protein
MLYRGIGHPWTAEPGWDQLFIGEDGASALAAKVAEAKEKFWKVWFHSEPTNRTHLFKPSGVTRDWKDVSWQGTPRGHGHQFKVGDEVYTDIGTPGGLLTRAKVVSHHTVKEIEFRACCQTGVMLRVDPAPRGSVYVDDRGNPAKGLPWIDSAWFRRMP